MSAAVKYTCPFKLRNIGYIGFLQTGIKPLLAASSRTEGFSETKAFSKSAEYILIIAGFARRIKNLRRIIQIIFCNGDNIIALKEVGSRQHVIRP